MFNFSFSLAFPIQYRQIHWSRVVITNKNASLSHERNCQIKKGLLLSVWVKFILNRWIFGKVIYIYISLFARWQHTTNNNIKHTTKHTHTHLQTCTHKHIQTQLITYKQSVLIVSCTCTPGQHTVKRRRKCTRQSRNFAECSPILNFFTRRLSNKPFLI